MVQSITGMAPPLILVNKYNPALSAERGDIL
jgi:hypothetical protein